MPASSNKNIEKYTKVGVVITKNLFLQNIENANPMDEKTPPNIKHINT